VRTRLLLRSCVDDRTVKAALGRRASPNDASVYLDGDAEVLKPDGSPLLIVRRGCFPAPMLEAAFAFMHALRDETTSNRGSYGGPTSPRPSVRVGNVYVRVGNVYRVQKTDGTLSNTHYVAPVRSTVVGAIDRTSRMPFCRTTAYATKYAEKWGGALPFIRAVGDLFGEAVPGRCRAQREAAERTHPAFVLPGTPFTTITVNNTVAGA
jgi:hypothetical protein